MALQRGGLTTNDQQASLTFTPDDPMASIMEPGRNYVSLGWWLTTNKMADGSLDSVDVRVAAFATGSEYNGATTNTGTNARNMETLVGLAKFMGIAAGKYAYSTTTSAGATAHEAGHFTAGATLTADWGNATRRTRRGDGHHFRLRGKRPVVRRLEG